MMSCQPRKLRAFSRERKKRKQEIINQRNVRMSCITQQIHKQTNNTHYTKIIFLRLLANHDVKPMNDELNF